MCISSISCKRIEIWFRFWCRRFVECEPITLTIRRRECILFFLIFRKVHECRCKSSHVHIHDFLRIHGRLGWRRLSYSWDSLRSRVDVFLGVNWMAAFVIFLVLMGRDVFVSICNTAGLLVGWRTICVSWLFMSTMMEISLFIFTTFSFFFLVIAANFLVNLS